MSNFTITGIWTLLKVCKWWFYYSHPIVAVNAKEWFSCQFGQNNDVKTWGNP